MTVMDSSFEKGAYAIPDVVRDKEINGGTGRIIT
jgi:hypothetical protein